MSDRPTVSTLPVPYPAVAKRFDELLAKARAYRPDSDSELLRRAYAFAAERHGAQKRKSGEPYTAHLVEVAHLLADMRLDGTSLASGLLHDVVEDTPATVNELRREFGAEIASCVNGVTKLGRLQFRSSEARQAETFRKMLLAMIEDIRVILVKLADRTHNMRTLEFLEPEKQRRIALETREIYAPIALRLGMGKVRSELEDHAFAVLDPDTFRAIADRIESRREASREFLDEVQRDLEEKLARAAIPVRLQGRVKRPYSIYQKLNRQKVTIDQVYDLLALRVITDTKSNCYAALGIIHTQWRPIPGRIKDFVAMPRPNLYQSLHTSVITDGGQRFEVQIRTEDMHRTAEEGICAHWKYKEGHSGADVDDRRMTWLRQLVEWQREVSDPSDFLSTLKIDLYPEDVYVFTPKGKLITLPSGATPVDFAYAIHTEVGLRCTGAKIEGRIVPLKYELQNGDIVEIGTRQNAHPSQDWLSFVKTSRARNKIRQWLNAQRRRKAEEIGVKLLEKEARRVKVSLKSASSQRLTEVCREYGCSSLADLHVMLGYGRHSARQVAAKLFPDHSGGEPAAAPTLVSAPSPAMQTGDANALVVEGRDDILVYRARCCNPLPGEAIVGYVTRGKGVGVHSGNCNNVRNLMYEAERRIDVAWAAEGDSTYQTRLTIYVDDKPGILNDLTGILSDEGLNIAKIESRGEEADRPVAIDLVVEVANAKQLDRVSRAINRLPYVREVSGGRQLQ